MGCNICLTNLHRTVKEEVLQGAVVTAVNDAYARKNIVTALLKQNIESTVLGDLEDRLAMVDQKLADLQAQMISVSGDEAAVDALGEQIDARSVNRVQRCHHQKAGGEDYDLR